MGNDFRESIGREQLRLVMQQVPTMQAASVVVALLLSYVVRDIVPRGKILSFVLLTLAVAASRVILYRRFLHAGTKPLVTKNWENVYLLLALLSGVVWGSSAFLILPHGDAWLLALFVLVLASLSASTTVSHSSIKWAPAAFIVPAMLFYAIRCGLDGGEHGPILAVLIVLYMIVMLQYSLKHHGTIASSIALRFENLKLLEASRQTEERFRSLSEASLEGIMVHDQGVILDANRAFAQLFGYGKPEELIGKNGPDLLLTPESRSRILQRIRQRGEGRIELTGVRKDGTTFAMETESRPMRYRGRDARIVSFQDLTDRKRDEEEKVKLQGQLQQAMKMEAIGRLAGGVAHDFNNILTVITGYCELLLQKIGKDSPMCGELEQIRQAGDRAALMTQQLLAFSRKQIIEPKVMRLDRLVTEVLAMLTRLIGEDIELQAITGKSPGSVKIDPGQFQQILMNLVVNARDAMPEGGKIVIETANVDLDEDYCALHPYVVPGRFVMLSVSDTGKGMSNEVKAHIFEPFFTTKERGSGTGLGLATAYGAVKQSGGSIEVYSEVGSGTTFKIYLPRVEGEEKTVKDARLVNLPGGAETVLLVEDEDIVRDLCSRILGNLGYRVVQARNGDEALALVMGYGERIDLLLTDVVMPGMSGRELATQLVLRHPEMKVLFMSGYTDDAIVHHGILDEGVSFIGKPYTPSALAGKVREVLDKA